MVFNKSIIFNETGEFSNNDEKWFKMKELLVDTDDGITTLNMPQNGLYIYSPHILLSGDFIITMDILMPKGSSFLSFGFSNNQKLSNRFKGFWNTSEFQQLSIKRINGYISYYLNGKFKDSVNLTSNNLFFQFILFSETEKYNFSFKNFKIETLSPNIDVLVNKIEDMENQIVNLTSKLDTNETILNSYYNYFNILFTNYKLKPKTFIGNTWKLCIEILNFVEKVCKKYNLEYWLDYGSLLGATRHEGFIPWDDDIDIGMMRRDYDKFMQNIHKEIIKNGLNNLLLVHRDVESDKNWINTFTSLLFSYEGYIFGAVDIFPYDFIIDPKSNSREFFLKMRDNHYKKIVQGTPRIEVYDEIYQKMNLSYEKTNHIICGVEHGSVYGRKLVYELDMIFPLKYINFKNNFYPCPNNVKQYLNSIYPNYIDIPKIVALHGRQKVLKRKENVNQLYDEFIEKMVEINKNFR